jgi:hypothetical protein
VSSDASPARQLLTRRRIITHAIGFLVGLALLAWCITVAIENGDWSRLRQADAGLVALLLGCTLLSLMINGLIFWATIRPVQPLRAADLQWLNLAASLLNYAPVRAGALTRIVYHLRIDRMPLLRLGAWFAAIALILVIAVGSCLAATLVRPRIDLAWAALVIGLLAAGGVAARVLCGHRLVARHGRGIDTMIRHRWSFWGAAGMRLADLAAFSGRMAAAAAILGLSVDGHVIVILAVVAFSASLIPFGRVGFREAAVAVVAARLDAAAGRAATAAPGSAEAAGDAETFRQAVEGWTQLSLVESAGEAAVVIPLGLLALLWLRRRWMARGASDRVPDRTGGAVG